MAWTSSLDLQNLADNPKLATNLASSPTLALAPSGLPNEPQVYPRQTTEDGAGKPDFTAKVNTTGDLGGLFFELNVSLQRYAHLHRARIAALLHPDQPDLDADRPAPAQ